MKKSFIALAFLGVLGLGSCSDTYNPTVDFGDKTYINDYTKLVDALNNINNTLNERLSALNQLIESGFASVKVAIDENTGAITAQTTTLKDGLGNINTTLLDGFTALNQKIDANGDKLVTAINKNGEVISMQIKSSGELISAKIETSTSAIIAAMNANNATLTGKLDALNTALTNGLANLKLSVDGLGSKLDVTNQNLVNINGSLANLDSSVKAQTEQIGDLAAKLLEGFNKVDAQLTTLNNGIGQIKVSIDAQKSEIANLNAAMTASLKALSDSISSLGGKLTFAINEQGQLIATALDAQNNIIETKLVASIAALGENLESLKEQIEGGNTALVEAIKEACKCGMSEDETAKNIYTYDEDALADGTYKQIYVKEDYYNSLNDEQKEALKELIGEVLSAELSKTQYANQFYGTKDELLANKEKAVPSGNGHTTENTSYLTHEHSQWSLVEAPADKIVAPITTDINGKTYYQVKRVQPYNIMSVKLTTGCGSKWYTGLYMSDATPRWIFYYGDQNITSSGNTYSLTNIKVVLYDEANGVFCGTPEGYLFTYEGSTSTIGATDTQADIDCTGK